MTAPKVTREELVAMLRELEWAGVELDDSDGVWKPSCVSCDELKVGGHSSGCAFGKLLARLDEPESTKCPACELEGRHNPACPNNAEPSPCFAMWEIDRLK